MRMYSKGNLEACVEITKINLRRFCWLYLDSISFWL